MRRGSAHEDHLLLLCLLLQVANAGLVAARDSALEEAAAAADETKRLAAEVARLKDELGETQEQLSNAKVGNLKL
jgi:hypothetical protein